jgi:PncC family amidohydrolase
VAVAESCTGGLIGHRITNVPGCSQYFKGDLVTYTYDVKEGVLGVSGETLKTHGAVSEECVREMAAGVRQRTGASVSVATSGIAGPDGGTPDKPVGTVCIALSADDQSFTRRYQFRGTRDWIKLITSQVALDWLRRYALGLPLNRAGRRRVGAQHDVGVAGEAGIFDGRRALGELHTSRADKIHRGYVDAAEEAICNDVARLIHLRACLAGVRWRLGMRPTTASRAKQSNHRERYNNCISCSHVQLSSRA